MEEWKEYKLGEIAKVTMGQSPESSSYNNCGVGIPFMQGNRTFGMKYPSFDTYTTSITKMAEANDVIISVRAPVGDVNITPVRMCLGRGLCGIRANNGNHEFLYYLLRYYSKELVNKESGTVFGSVNRNDISNLSVRIPRNETQNVIANVLSSLDNKIEINRRINDNFTLSFLLLTYFVLWLLKLRNDNLQNQADALFKSFFVDFELFREGEFIETELGLIPKDWKILLFGDFIVALTEKAPVDSLPEYSVTNNGIIPRDTKFNKKLSKSSSMNKVLRKNNLVFGMSREILNWGIMEDEIGGVSSAYNIYKIDEDLVDPTYLRLYMKAKISEFNSLIGTAAREGQSLDKGQLMQRKIYVPTKDVLQDFFAHYVPIMESIHNAEQESSRLAQLRDALLPKLMSGELKISELTL